MSYTPKFGLAIDWETSGYSLPNYAENHQGLSFGAIIFDVKTFESVDTIYHEIKFDPKYQWSETAEKIHGLSRNYLNTNGVSQEEATTSLVNLIIKYIGTEDIMLLGHRVHFDKAFTQQLTESQGVFLNYHPTTIDSASIATVLLETSKSDEIFSMLGLPKRGQHNALEDIMYTLDSVRIMKNFFLSGILNESK